MAGNRDGSGPSRRAVLQATGGVVGLTRLGVGRASEDPGATGDDEGGHGGGDLPTPFCPGASVRPSMEPCRGAETAGCADDHPATRELQRRVRESLATRYPDVGTLVEEGYLPYFDLFSSGEAGGYSHWLHPGYIGDDVLVDPERPESVLVDNKWWRPIGAMFVATERGDRVDAPPPVYRLDGDGEGGQEGGERGGKCSPWHYHEGLPGRFGWWVYRKAYTDAVREGDLRVPCLTACMLHVWTYPNPAGVYAHRPPPRGNRGGPPAEDPGFDTPQSPGEDDLGWDALPEEVVERARPRGVPEDATVEGILDWLDW